MIEGLNATGITEDIDLVGNIELIKRLQATVKKVYMVTDHSVTGEAIRAQIDLFIEKNPNFADLIEHYGSRLIPRTDDFFAACRLREKLAVLGVLPRCERVM